MAPHEVVIESPREGVLGKVDTKAIGRLMVEAGAGRAQADDEIDYRVSLRYSAVLGEKIGRGQELARLFLSQPDEDLQSRFEVCFQITECAVEAPPLLVDQIRFV